MTQTYAISSIRPSSPTLWIKTLCPKGVSEEEGLEDIAITFPHSPLPHLWALMLLKLTDESNVEVDKNVEVMITELKVEENNRLTIASHGYKIFVMTSINLWFSSIPPSTRDARLYSLLLYLPPSFIYSYHSTPWTVNNRCIPSWAVVFKCRV